MNSSIDASVQTLPFSTASDDDVSALLSQYQIGLTIEEARKISDLLGRDPTMTEAVIWGIQGSEHCSYKSSRRFLKGFTTTGKHIILGPVEDSGVVAITDGPKGKRWGLAVTHESHNHPSQIVPYEGAATGIGGTVRDILCMGARVIGCMDMLRLGDLKTPETRTIAKEVIRGIGGYGNPLGVPNLGGDTVFDSSYNSNCLVNAIALGIVREDEIIHSYTPKEAGKVGYQIILVGKPTDKSGFGGASFASASMEEDKKEQNSGAVQEPNPFLERHLLASTYALFDWLSAEGHLDKISYKDLGAGGVVCASVEQVADLGFGADLNLDSVHTALDGLPAEVIACAETQERLCWICHPDLTEHILNHYNTVWDLPNIAQNARASLVGTVNEDGIFRITHKGKVVCEAKSKDITDGLQYVRPTQSYEYTGTEPDIEWNDNTITVSNTGLKTSIADVFSAMLTHKNAASKSSVFKHFDKTVIGNTIVEAGEADASVIAPLQDLQSYVHDGVHPSWDDISEEDAWRGVAIAADGNNRYGRISPYWQGVNATVESMYNVAAVGAVPRAITDCLNYGNPEIPEQLWELEEGVRGIADASANVLCEGDAVPVISGNVSLYNGKPDGSSIDPTAIVSCTGIMPDARKAVTMQIQQSGSSLFLVGQRKNECGGSLYYHILEEMSEAETDALLGTEVPKPDFAVASKEIGFISAAIQKNLVLSSHDISQGGLLLALFEMLTPQRKRGGNLGMQIQLESLQSSLRHDQVLFSETEGFIAEVPDNKKDEFLASGKEKGVIAWEIGRTIDSPLLIIENGSKVLFSGDLRTMISQWSSALEEELM